MAEEREKTQEEKDKETLANWWAGEYWGEGDYASNGIDCTKMEETYLYEMCADWAATSEEMGTDLMGWYDKVVNTKFMFTEEQIKIIKPMCVFLNFKLDKNYIGKDDMKSVKLSTLGVRK